MRPGRFIGISVLVILLLLLFGDGVIRDDSQAPTPETTVSSSPTPVTSTPSTKQETPTPTPTSTPVPATLTPTCSTTSGPITPARMVIDRLGIDVAVDQKPLNSDLSLPVPLDGKGNDVRWAATWVTNTPRPGAAGVADFTTHSYHHGDAVGNRLATIAVVGDIIRLVDAGGKQLCFQVTSIKLDYPAAHLPATDLYNAGGPSRVAIVFCTNYNWVTGQWPTRGVVMANLI